MESKKKGKSDLREEKKISGEIKVKSSLHDHSEMSTPQKTHIQADRLERTCAKETHAHAHTRSSEAHISRTTDACTFMLDMRMDTNMHAGTHSNMHPHINPTVRREKAKAMCCGEALERWRAEPVPAFLPTASSSSSWMHAVTHTPCSPLREKHLLLLQCAAIIVKEKERVGKQGMERKNTSKDLSLLLLGTCCSSPEPSELRSFTHARPKKQTHTHARELHQRW